MPWFIYNGTPAPVLTPSSYTLVGAQPTCPGTGNMCAIFAASDGNGLPIITDALRAEIIKALNTGMESANVLLKD